VDIEVGGSLLFQLIEELNEFMATMTRQATPQDSAVEDVEGAENVAVPCRL
jgi:hypothetical protein